MLKGRLTTYITQRFLSYTFFFHKIVQFEKNLKKSELNIEMMKK